jgi:hypothetical protein
MPLNGRQMLPREAAKILWNEGWLNAENLMIMVATAMGESNLFVKAFNFNPPTSSMPKGSYDWGWLQLNDGGKQGQEQEEFKVMAFDPVKAAKFARPMYEKRQFSPWYAYKNGAWEKFIPQATMGVANMLREKYEVTLL